VAGWLAGWLAGRLAGWLIRAVVGFNTSLLTIIALNELLQLTVGIAYPFHTQAHGLLGKQVNSRKNST